MSNETRDKGLRIRREAIGADYVEEIEETPIRIGACCGVPTGAAMFRIAGRVIGERE